MPQLGTQQDFGTDISTQPDLDPSFSSISGNRVLAEICIRRWTTVRGSVPDALDAGSDIRDLLNEQMTGLSGNTGQSTLQRMKQMMENEAKRDQRIRNCAVLLTYQPASSSVIGTATIDGGNGPFTLEVAITGVSVTLLRLG